MGPAFTNGFPEKIEGQLRYGRGMHFIDGVRVYIKVERLRLCVRLRGRLIMKLRSAYWLPPQTPFQRPGSLKPFSTLDCDLR